MAFYRGPHIVTDGLISCLDAANVKSYPGSGTTWFDLSNNNRFGTLFNGVSFNNGVMSLDGLNDYVIISGDGSNNNNAWTADGSVGSSDICMEIWFKTTDSVGLLISKPWNGSGQYNISLTQASFALIDGSGSTSVGFGNTNNGEWRQLVVWASSSQIGYYINGGETSGVNNHSLTGGIPSAGNATLPMGIGTLYFYGQGWSGSTSHALECDVALFRKYNRVLTSDEVLQNFNANKKRFGL